MNLLYALILVSKLGVARSLFLCPSVISYFPNFKCVIWWLCWNLLIIVPSSGFPQFFALCHLKSPMLFTPLLHNSSPSMDFDSSDSMVCDHCKKEHEAINLEIYGLHVMMYQQQFSDCNLLNTIVALQQRIYHMEYEVDALGGVLMELQLKGVHLASEPTELSCDTNLNRPADPIDNP